VIHPYISAAIRLRNKHAVQVSDIESVDCPVTGFIVSIVCEPIAEKHAPASDSHGRVSLQYSIAETLFFGELGKHAYSDQSRRNPEILALAGKVRYHVDPDYPGPGRFKGAVSVTLKDGRQFTEVEEYNRGSAENPMTDEELRAKFEENAGGFLSAASCDQVADRIQRLEALPDAKVLVELSTNEEYRKKT
jgi:2-methylcitrate dehydratase PrpD